MGHGSTAVRQARDVLRVIAGPDGPQILHACRHVADTLRRRAMIGPPKKNCAGRGCPSGAVGIAQAIAITA
jgi:hypothetical protein